MKRLALALCGLIAIAVLRPSTGMGQSSIDPAALSRVESALAVVSCPSEFTTGTISVSTAIVLSSNAQHSYLLTSAEQPCVAGAVRTVHPQGDSAQRYPARVVLLDANACAETHPDRSPVCLGPNGVEPVALGMEFVAIDRGGLPAAQLAAQSIAGPAYVLSYTQPLGAVLSGRLQARLNVTSIPTGDTSVTGEMSAARGISDGGAVIDASGRLIAAVWSNADPPQGIPLLGETPPPLPPTSDYRLDFLRPIRNLAQFSAEPIALR